MFQFQQKLKWVKEHIKDWNHNIFGNIFVEKRTLEQQMKDVQQEIITSGRSEPLAAKELELQRKLEDRYKQEEILWRQKSRFRWLKEGE